MKKIMAVAVGLAFLFSAFSVVAAEKRSFWQRLFQKPQSQVEQKVESPRLERAPMERKLESPAVPSPLERKMRGEPVESAMKPVEVTIHVYSVDKTQPRPREHHDVEGARVFLGNTDPLGGGKMFVATTDSSGNAYFTFSAYNPCLYSAAAWKSGYIPGVWQPIHIPCAGSASREVRVTVDDSMEEGSYEILKHYIKVMDGVSEEELSDVQYILVCADEFEEGEWDYKVRVGKIVEECNKGICNQSVEIPSRSSILCIHLYLYKEGYAPYLYAPAISHRHETRGTPINEPIKYYLQPLTEER